MRRTRLRRHHHPAGLARRIVLGLCVPGALLLALPAARGATTVRVHLPTEADAIAYATLAETILYGKHGIETRLPGPASDRERVSVDFGVTGEPVRVRVVQRLQLTGLGDFSFKVPGPAFNVEALPASENEPGLRKGALLWQGFSPGRKFLGATMDLHPDLEAPRLPLQVHLSIRVDGKPLEPGEQASGPLELSLEVRNVSAIPVGIREARADPTRLARILDSIGRSLRHGERPRPGSGGIPRAVGARGPETSKTEQIEAPFTISGVVAFPPGRVSGLRAPGSTDASGGRVRFEAQLGGGAPLSTSIRITGVARNLSLPEVEFSARTATPVAETVRPPTGSTWSGHVRSGAALDPVRMLDLTQETLWRVARLRQFDNYVGNPDTNGPARTSYTFQLRPASEEAAPIGAASSGVRPFGLLAVSLLLVAAGFGLALAWAHA